MVQDHLNFRGLVIEDKWIDVRDAEALAQAQRQFSKKEKPEKYGRGKGEG